MKTRNKIIEFKILTDGERLEFRREKIAAIQKIRDELKPLRVRNEIFNLEKLSDEELIAELDAKAEQLERRKKFLGENFR